MRLFPNRIGKPSSKWAFWRWYDIVLDDKLYLSRLNLLKTPWFSVKLHWIHRPDPDRDLHSHPWWFIAFILRGGYWEFHSKTPNKTPGCLRYIRWLNFYKPDWGHRISTVKPKTLTLVITGAKDRKKDWGFYNEKTLEYTHWRKYEEMKNYVKG